MAKLWKLWGKQHKSFEDAFPCPADVRTLHDAIPDGEKPGYRRPDGAWQPYDRPQVGDWQAKVDLSARQMEAQKSIRHFPEYDAGSGDVPPKCSMLGSYEQMGPADLAESAEFWRQAADNLQIEGVRVRQGERLCAVALVKRFAGPCFFRKELGLARADLRYDDTATVAAAQWLQRAGIDHEEIRKERGAWSGQWLHWPRRDFDKDDPCPQPVWDQIQDKRRAPDLEAPPIYYAILVMDGDNLGDWLRGNKSPLVKDVLHKQLVDYFQNLLPKTKAGLDAQRPVSPALHAALSSALANFALHVVPDVVEKQHHGTLIYAGGDDTLALLPTREALACARKLQQAYQSDYYPNDRTGRLMMGKTATLSAGLVVVHYKEDLRAALDAAREAEKRAKKAGRDLLVITACRRSGEHASALCPWEFVDTVAGWLNAFRDQASDRWAYRLKAELPTLQRLPVEAMQAEIRRQLKRSDKRTQAAFQADDIIKAFKALRGDQKMVQDQRKDRFSSPGEALADFLTLIQTASFLARGRDA